MSALKITYYGHSCFRIEADGYSAVLDPYAVNSVPGINLPGKISANAVYCSHEHGDHNAADLITVAETDASPFEAEFITVPHDDAGGSLRGMNRIAVIQAGDIKTVHMGDIGRMPSDEEYRQLEDTDVLMIPVGGHYTIDAVQAAEIVRKVSPKLTILMHFRKGNRGYDVIADIETVKNAFPALECLDDSEIIFEKESGQRIITLEPLQ